MEFKDKVAADIKNIPNEMSRDYLMFLNKIGLISGCAATLVRLLTDNVSVDMNSPLGVNFICELIELQDEINTLEDKLLKNENLLRMGKQFLPMCTKIRDQIDFCGEKLGIGKADRLESLER